MNHHEFSSHVEKITEECKRLLISKGIEYSNLQDRLVNFKSCEVSGVSELQNCLTHISKHMSAISIYVREDARGNLASHKMNQTIHTRVLDLINYFILFDAIVIDKSKSEIKLR
jgi:hypothetical protein